MLTVVTIMGYISARVLMATKVTEKLVKMLMNVLLRTGNRASCNRKLMIDLIPDPRKFQAEMSGRFKTARRFP